MGLTSEYTLGVAVKLPHCVTSFLPLSALTVIFPDNLEVLDRCLCDASMEVEHVGLCLLVPGWHLVSEFNQVLHVLVLVPGQ